MADYGSPRRQYASPQRQLSRDGRMRPARDLDTRTPRYSPPSSPPPPSTPSPTKRGSPSPEAPRYSRSTPKTRPSPVTYGSPGGVSTYTQRTGGSTAAWERALHRRVAALEHQLKAEVQANDELRRQAAGDTVDDGSIDTQTSLAAAKAAWRRERRVLERQLHAARAAAADAVARRPMTSVEDDESVDVTDVAALVDAFCWNKKAIPAKGGAPSFPAHSAPPAGCVDLAVDPQNHTMECLRDVSVCLAELYLLAQDPVSKRFFVKYTFDAAR